MIDEKLKPCPFCGSNDLNVQHSTEDREGVPANVICHDCGCAGPWTYLKRDLIEQFWDDFAFPTKLVKLWNERKLH